MKSFHFRFGARIEHVNNTSTRRPVDRMGPPRIEYQMVLSAAFRRIAGVEQIGAIIPHRNRLSGNHF